MDKFDFLSISIVIQLYQDDNKKLYAMESCLPLKSSRKFILQLKRFSAVGIELGTIRSAGQCLTHEANGAAVSQSSDTEIGTLV